MSERNVDEREAFIAKAVDQAVLELADLRSNGSEVCDIAYIEGSMIEAAKEYDLREKTRT
jgi:hypothetical protein|nr:hypothetical protein [Neorhizobium tomejilense]